MSKHCPVCGGYNEGQNEVCQACGAPSYMALVEEVKEALWHLDIARSGIEQKMGRHISARPFPVTLAHINTAMSDLEAAIAAIDKAEKRNDD
jgi:hypothetical protein